ncbi:pseudouridine synthase [Acaromyces ingoldii]|uniref:Pseudouridine synthase n=1 Tax=Acaromyces ingoldii TaxID=215250 RepID=A0A316YL86_9BASI|nr:pseudouridine synthase [Acaromyces ingoldii]PWN89564.1 pseudouridine synthase [Acaromyces ingoldii]
MTVSRYTGMSRQDLIARLEALEGRQGQQQVASTAFKEDGPKGVVASSRTFREQEPNGASSSAISTDTGAEGSSGSTGGSGSGRRKQSTKKKEEKEFSVSDQPCRKIALRFSYDGAHYSGLAAQIGAPTVVPTVEAVLWEAMCVARLVDPDKGMAGAGWSRCGRTDRGVSAAGQVVALWVRSRKVDQRKQRQRFEAMVEERKKARQEQGLEASDESDDEEVLGPASDLHEEQETVIDADGDELPYIGTLNRILPPTIHVQAWSPVRPDFSARFDCRYRHYKYFFTAGAPPWLHSSSNSLERRQAFGPVPRLDIDRMREAAQRLLGDHDFRNMCKIDASKQITNFRRRIDGASIDRVHPGWPVVDPGSSTPREKAQQEEQELSPLQDPTREDMYVLNLRGTAFLYHQVRHIVQILFLVGAHLEDVSIVDELFNVAKGQTKKDRKKMRVAGVEIGRGDTYLPGSTSTEPDGKVASSGTGPRLVNGEQTDEEGDAGEEQTDDEELQRLSSLAIYDRKPQYEMASDRPLVLWDCGFRPGDIQWRAGMYDGPLSNLDAPSKAVDLTSPLSMATASLHTLWSSHAIQAEMTKHFLLAMPRLDNGTLPASTTFDKASFPGYPGARAKVDVEGFHRDQRNQMRRILPLGNGSYKTAIDWKGLYSRKREDTADEKNLKYREGAGKRRAERVKLREESQQQQIP